MPPRDDDEPPVLVRIVEGLSGTVEMDVTLRVRFGYGSVMPWVRQVEDGIRATAGPGRDLAAHAGPLTGHGMAHQATFSRHRGRARSRSC